MQGLLRVNSGRIEPAGTAFTEIETVPCRFFCALTFEGSPVEMLSAKDISIYFSKGGSNV